MLKMIRPWGATAVVVLGLSACSLSESVDLDIFNVKTQDQGAAPDGSGQARSGEAQIPPMPRRKPPEVAALPAGALDVDPELVVGLDFIATEALLGVPAAQVEQPPAKIWAYDGGHCVLNVFFYPSLGDNVFRVLTYEVTSGEHAAGSRKPGAKLGARAAVTAPAADSQDTAENVDKVRRCFAEVLSKKGPPDAG
jgi:hypothetical protein